MVYSSSAHPYLEISYKKRSARANESMSSECSSSSARSSADGVNFNNCSTISMGSCSFESIDRIALDWKKECENENSLKVSYAICNCWCYALGNILIGHLQFAQENGAILSTPSIDD